jgi:quercetin dioxygenase-like cupin family protein
MVQAAAPARRRSHLFKTPPLRGATIGHMKLITDRHGAIDLLTIPVHLGLGSRAMPVEGFTWQPEALESYSAAVAADGAEGRMVMIFDGDGPWTSWECHPEGDELVVCLDGRITMIREIDGEPDPVELGAGEAMINPAGVWHTADIAGRARILTVTPGLGTEHRPR